MLHISSFVVALHLRHLGFSALARFQLLLDVCLLVHQWFPSYGANGASVNDHVKRRNEKECACDFDCGMNFKNSSSTLGIFHTQTAVKFTQNGAEKQKTRRERQFCGLRD